MIQAVVVVARVVFRHDEVDRVHAVEGVLEVGTVAVLAVGQPAAVAPGAAGVVRVHVVGIEIDAAEKVHDAARRQPEQVRVGDIVAPQRSRRVPRRIEPRGRPPRQRIVRLRKPVIDATLDSVLGVDSEIAPVGQHQERRIVVVVLLEMAVQHGPLRGARGEVAHRDFDVPPAGSAVVAVVSHGTDRSHDELAVVDDGPLVHEPGPGAVVVQLDQLSGHVVGGQVRDPRYERGEQTHQPQLAHRSSPHRASGSGRSWKCTTLLVVPLPPSMWNGARVLTVAHSPRPFQPAFGSSIRPSIHFV